MANNIAQHAMLFHTNLTLAFDVTCVVNQAKCLSMSWFQDIFQTYHKRVFKSLVGQ